MTHIVERERELTVIGECLASARDGGGGLLTLEGTAGIGKTRLLELAGERARRRGFRVLVARGGELEREFAFGVVRQLFEPLLNRSRAEWRREMLTGAASLCGPLFAVKDSGAAAPAGDLGLRQLHGLYWLCVNLCGKSPVLLLVDDLHWADSASLRFLVYLARRLEGLPLAVVAGLRPGESGVDDELVGAFTAAPGALVLRPGALSESGVATVVVDVFGVAGAPAFAERCRAATGGNPFLVRQLMAALAADGRRPTAAEAEHVVDVGPETVGRWIAHRLRRHAASAERICAALAVLGGSAEVRHCAALAGTDVAAALVDIDALCAAEILELGETVAFAHPILQAAVYGRLPVAERERGHRAAARILEADGRPAQQVAAHLARLQPRGDDWTARTLLTAAHNAAASGAPESAVSLLERALREPPPAALRGEVLLALGIAESHSGRAGAIEHLTAALDLVTDLPRLATGTIAVTLALGMAGRMPEGLARLEQAIDRTAPVDRELALTLEAVLGATSRLAAEGEPLAPRWDRYGPITGATSGERMVLGELAWERAMTGAPADEVATLAEAAIADGAETILLERGAQPQFFQACVLLVIAERFDRAEAALRDALAAARAAGSLWITATAEFWLADLALRRGRVAEAEAHARTAVDLCTIVGWADVLASMRAMVAQTLIERAALDEAEDALALTTPAESLPPPLTWGLALEGRARLRLAQGRMSEALADLRVLGAREHARRGDNPASCPWRSLAALALHALGEPREATRLADAELALARRFGAPRALGIALRTAGLVGGGDGSPARLREAVSVLRRSRGRLELARALIDLGAATRRAGARVRARELLREGLELATACGSIAEASRAHAELLASGARPRRLSFHGVDSLTASERRVAALAADGLGNVAIAQALFVSRKTIETHLGHVYEKLAIASRGELAGVLGPGG